MYKSDIVYELLNHTIDKSSKFIVALFITIKSNIIIIYKFFKLNYTKKNVSVHFNITSVGRI